MAKKPNKSEMLIRIEATLNELQPMLKRDSLAWCWHIAALGLLPPVEEWNAADWEQEVSKAANRRMKEHNGQPLPPIRIRDHLRSGLLDIVKDVAGPEVYEKIKRRLGDT